MLEHTSGFPLNMADNAVYAVDGENEMFQGLRISWWPTNDKCWAKIQIQVFSWSSAPDTRFWERNCPLSGNQLFWNCKYHALQLSFPAPPLLKICHLFTVHGVRKKMGSSGGIDRVSMLEMFFLPVSCSHSTSQSMGFRQQRCLTVLNARLHMKYLYGAGRQDVRPMGYHDFLDWQLTGRQK